MKVNIRIIKDKGELSKERLVLKVLGTTEIGQYLVCDTTYNDDDSVSNHLRHVFWFPDKIVETDDYVVLYTKKGRDKQYKNKSGSITHAFYWGLNKTVWNKKGDGAVLFRISDWIAKDMVKED